MFCCISGEVPSDPVVSRLTGHLYERALVEKHLLQSGTCPMSKQAMNTEDLLSVQANTAVRPRPTETATFPGMLVALKHEWDEVMLETFTLKQALDTTRKELSQTLYQHDAACRVIARLMAENAELNALVGNGNGAGAGAGAGAMDVDASTVASASVVATTASVLPPAVHAAVTAKQEALHAARKGNKHPDLMPKDRITNGGNVEAGASADVDIGKSKAAKATGLHHCTANVSGDLVGAVDTALVVTCVVDGDIVSSKFKAGAKAVTATAWAANGSDVLCGFSDGTVKLFSSDGTRGGKFTEEKVWEELADQVVAVAAHPSGAFVAAFTATTYTLLGADGVALFTHPTGVPEGAITSAAFHPDGGLLGCVTDSGTVTLWDVSSGATELTVGGGGVGASVLVFSENGYLAAVCGGVAGDAAVQSTQLLDLRHQSFTKSIDGGAAAAAFDASGKYVACATDAGLTASFGKEWKANAVPAAGSDALVGCAWAPNGAGILSISKTGAATYSTF